MNRSERAWVLATLTAVLAACGAPAASPTEATGPESTSPTRICDIGVGAEAPPISCTEAIGEVLLVLGPEARSAQAAWFRPGAPCPPNARCFAPPLGSAYVVVRLEGSRTEIIRLAVDGGEVIVGEREDPSFDIWPPSGEAIPAVGRPDPGHDAPAEVAAREAMPLCGDLREGVDDQRVARRCFFGAVQDGRPAELVIRSVAAAANPAVRIHRFAGRGPVLVYVYWSARPVGPGWVRDDCAIGSVADDELIFLVDECLSTELS
jgi:hypothetical protein